MEALPPRNAPIDQSPADVTPRPCVAPWLLVPAVGVGVLLGMVLGAVLPGHGEHAAQSRIPKGPPDYTFSLSSKENALPQGGVSDLEEYRHRTPTVLVMRVDPGIYDVTLESGLNLCMGHSDAALDQVFLTNWHPLDPEAWYEVLTEGEVCRIEVRATGGPPHAFIIDEATRDNRGTATIRLYRVP